MNCRTTSLTNQQLWDASIQSIWPWHEPDKREPATRNESAEQLLLACLLSTPGLIPRVSLLGIKPSDYAEYGHAEIAAILTDQWILHQDLQADELVAELRSALGREVKPTGILAECLRGFCHSRWWRLYVERVAQASYSRLLERNAEAFLKALRDRSNRPADIEALRQEHEAERLAMVQRLEAVL